MLALASTSPRRAELVKKLNTKFIVLKPDFDESLLPLCRPREYAALAARRKAESVTAPDCVVLGADTVVATEGRIFGKPRGDKEAEEFFRALCGRTHEVYTGYCLIRGSEMVTGCEVSYVTFGPFDEAVVFPYIESGAPFDKAGGYGIQDEALRPLIVEVRGDPDNIVGLPVAKICDILKERSWISH